MLSESIGPGVKSQSRLFRTFFRAWHCMIWHSLLITATLCSGGDHNHPTGYIAPIQKTAIPKQAQPYIPKEGDLIFFDDHNFIWTALFVWAGSGPPLHVGIVVKKTDGALAI